MRTSIMLLAFLATSFTFAILCTTAAAATPTTASIIYTPAALADQITNLPGLSTQPTFNQFAGYLQVNAEKFIFYWYTESQKTPATDPLIWWSNGGPGCSGLIGFFTEHGPFRPNITTGGLDPFPFAWNTLANTLYVEAPIGVGFSYSTDNSSHFFTGDAQVAADNFAAIEAFFVKFPHLTTNDFYISAESYGGHYVPELAKVIVEAGSISNFKGFYLGNPLTDSNVVVNWGMGPTFCGHALASNPTCTAFTQHCQGASGPDSECDDAFSQVVNEAGNLNAYGLDFPACTSLEEKKRLLAMIFAKRKYHPSFSPTFKKQLESIPAPYDPCGEREETLYLERPDVMAAIHANPNVPPWVACTGRLIYNETDSEQPMEPIYTYLLSVTPPLRMVIFSGDDDSVCPTLSTMYWMNNLLGSEVTSPWGQWTYEDEEYGSQIGGSIVQYKGISLVTVHGAGHMVDQYKPQKGLAAFANFLSGAFSTTSNPTQIVDEPSLATKKQNHKRSKKILH